MLNDENYEENVMTWYVNTRPTFVNLASKVESIIREVLDYNGAIYYSITSRAKEIESFTKKAKKEKYKNPIEEIKDLAGIRIITFVKSEVDYCCEIIKPLFVIDPDHSIDKTKELGTDRVGYRSIHYVAKLTNERLLLPEYKKFKDLSFEIQIRTILEHAWADISHERNYKFNGVLPPENDIERRFSLAAATLELVDREFDSLSKEIELYANVVKQKVSREELDIELNTTSLINYLSSKFSEQIEKGWIIPDLRNRSNEIIKELHLFGISSLKDLEELIGDNLQKYSYEKTNFLGLLRDIMMINDINKYFEKSWSKAWRSIELDTVKNFRKLGVPIDKIIKKYKLDVDASGYGDYIENFGEIDEEG